MQGATGWDLSQAARGIDGCSIPTFAIPLRHLALAFARVATGHGLSDGHARAAQPAAPGGGRAPFMVAGTDRFDTRVMQRLGERVFCKVGAEGVYCAALPGRGPGRCHQDRRWQQRPRRRSRDGALIEAFVSPTTPTPPSCAA